jgi:hypothetical protein
LIFLIFLIFLGVFYVFISLSSGSFVFRSFDLDCLVPVWFEVLPRRRMPPVMPPIGAGWLPLQAVPALADLRPRRKKTPAPTAMTAMAPRR